MSTYNIYLSLLAQLDKLARHNRQGSYQTKRRYYEAMQRFCRYLAEAFHLQKLSNVSAKHFAAYVEFMQENGKAVVENRDYIACAMYLGRFAGLRIHEVFRIDTAIAEQALREDAITIKGKGGKVRTVPIEDERVRLALRTMLGRTERGHKLFVPDDVPTDRAINGIQLFLLKHRDEIADEGREANITFHGLRHTYAALKYHDLIECGVTALDAHFAVSRLLGHERADVTNIYLASVKKEGRDGE